MQVTFFVIIYLLFSFSKASSTGHSRYLIFIFLTFLPENIDLITLWIE